MSTPAASGSGGGSNSTKTSASASPSSSASGDLATASSTLGNIVVNGKGMTVYVFDKDTVNTKTSACTGECLAAWPVVTTTSAKPSVSGVTGTVGTIATPDGKKQVTLNGLPLYTYSADTAKGETKGQGVMGIWWVVSPDGKKVTSSASGY